YAGYATSLRYGSLGKVITHGDDFVSAVGLLSEALRELRMEGVATNIPLLRRILGHPAFVAGDYDTRFIGENLNTLLQPLDDQPALQLPGDASGARADDRRDVESADGAGDAVRAAKPGVV